MANPNDKSIDYEQAFTDAIQNSNRAKLVSLLKNYAQSRKDHPKKQIYTVSWEGEEDHYADLLLNPPRLNELDEKTSQYVLDLINGANLALIKPFVEKDESYAGDDYANLSKYKFTILHTLAAREGDEQPAAVEYLLRHGTHVNRPDTTGITAFHSAVHHKQFRMVDLMLQYKKPEVLGIISKKRRSAFDKTWDNTQSHKTNAVKLMAAYGGALGKRGGIFQSLQGKKIALWGGYHHFTTKKKIMDVLEKFDDTPTPDNYKTLINNISAFLHNRKNYNIHGDMAERLVYLITQTHTAMSKAAAPPSPSTTPPKL